MADQAINALPTKTTPATGDKVLMIGTAEEYQMLVNDLATAILNKLTSKTFSLDQGTKTLIAALNELNSNSMKLRATITDFTDLDNILSNQIVYIQGASYENYINIYGYALCMSNGNTGAQLIVCILNGAIRIMIRVRSGSPISWKDWEIK